MRGKDSSLLLTDCELRITPAYAGKSCQIQNFQIIGRDHPRLCGEKPNLILKNFELQQSPPPMRGKAKIQQIAALECRITPAYAGKSRY